MPNCSEVFLFSIFWRVWKSGGLKSGSLAAGRLEVWRLEIWKSGGWKSGSLAACSLEVSRREVWKSGGLKSGSLAVSDCLSKCHVPNRRFAFYQEPLQSQDCYRGDYQAKWLRPALPKPRGLIELCPTASAPHASRTPFGKRDDADVPDVLA